MGQLTETKQVTRRYVASMLAILLSVMVYVSTVSRWGAITVRIAAGMTQRFRRVLA